MEQCKWQGQIHAVKLYSPFATNQGRERKISCQKQHLYSVVSDSLQPHWFYSPWNSPDQNTRVGSLSLLQEIFPTQESNQGLLHWRWILYQLSHKGSPRILEWVSYPFSSRSSPLRNQTRVSCIAGGFFTSWAMREACQSAVGDAESQITGERFRRTASQLRSCCGFAWCSFGALASNASTGWQQNLKTATRGLLLPRHQSGDPGRHHWCSLEGPWKPPARQHCYLLASQSTMISPCFLWNYQNTKAGRKKREKHQFTRKLTCKSTPVAGLSIFIKKGHVTLVTEQ